MKKWLALLLVLLLMPISAVAEEQSVINKIKDPLNDFSFPADAKLLEIYFPRIYDCAAAFIRYGEYSMLFDCAGDQWEQVARMLNKLGVTELTYACNSHPHTDHLRGFDYVLQDIPAGEFQRFFEDDYRDANASSMWVYKTLRELGVPFRQMKNGDTIPFGEVKITALQMLDPKFSGNNESALLMVELGQRRCLFASDIQLASQKRLVAERADIRADILQHPHHGYNGMNVSFLEAVNPELVIVTSLPDAAGGVKSLKEKGIAFQYTHPGIVKLTTDGNVWVVELIK